MTKVNNKGNNQTGFADIWLIVVLFVLVLAGVFVVSRIISTDQTVSEAEQASVESSVLPENPRPDDIPADPNQVIFDEVSTALELNSEEVSSFYIYSDNRVSFVQNDETAYVYKFDGNWELAAQSKFPPLCSSLDRVPAEYRPPCYIEGDNNQEDQFVYQNEKGEPTNYPQDNKTIFIEP